MRTVRFEEVLHGAARRFGLDPDTADLSVEQAASLTEFVNTRLREAWEHAFWPELVVVEQRAYRDAYDAATAYTAGDEVWVEADGAYYVALGAVTGEDPGSSENWEEAGSGFARYVAFAQTGQTVIDAVQQVTILDPRVHVRPKLVQWFKSHRGVECPGGPNQVWVSFRERAPVMSSALYSQEQAYAAGDLVYYAGDTWKALQAVEAVTPAEGEDWTLVAFPYVLAEVVKLGAYADLLREDGQGTKAEVAEARMMDALANLEFVEFEAQTLGTPGYSG